LDFLYGQLAFLYGQLDFFYGQLDFLYGQLNTFYMVNLTFYMVNLTLFIWSTFEFLMTSTMHCAQNQTKMAASKEDVQQISSACAIAKQALEAIGNLQNKDIRNVAALTATNSSSTNSISSSSSGSIAAELARRFPSYNARGATSKKRPSTSSSTNSMSRGKKNGRPNKTIIHKDLVIIPNPDTNQVPSHVSKVKLEERGLIIHQLPFNKDWTHLDLKETSKANFQGMILCLNTLRLAMEP